MLIALIAAGACHSLLAQHTSLLGYSGLMLAPSADVAADGQVTVGIGRIPQLYANLRPYERTVYFCRLGYLPFLEGTAMIVRPDDYPGGIGDRSVHVKVRLLRQRGKRPAVAVGMQDFFAVKGLKLEPARAQHFAALYAVASRDFKLKNLAFGVHAGYGTDWLPAKSYFLDGFFSGITFSPHHYLTLLAEYDAYEINAGLRLHPCSHLQAQLAYWKLQHWMGTMTLSVSLY